MQTKQTSESQQDGAATRAAILNAGRVVAARDGVENLTLGKVATETGLRRSLVYRQFARKEDLLMAIVSDDLTALARTMRGIEWPAGGDTPESAVILSLPRAEATPVPVSVPEPVIVDTPVTQAPIFEARAVETPAVEASQAEIPPADAAPAMIDIAKDVSAALAVVPPAARPRLARRGDLAQILEAKPAATTEEPEAKPAETPRAPDAWLERRLRTFERSVSGLETRQEQVEKNARASAATAEEAIKALQATVEELKARADAADTRHKTSSNEVRTALNETALRIQTVEGVARAALAENSVTPQAPAAEPEPLVMAPPAEAPHEPATPVVAPLETRHKSVIADVRKSVVAASAAAAEAEAKVAVKARTGGASRTRYLLGGLVALTLLVAAAGMAFSKGVSDGRRDALTHVTRLLPHAAATRQTSLDQLTARAEAGDPRAELLVGLRYLNGEQKNPSEAMRWVTQAAIHGQPVAQYLLGTLYAQGTGTPADPARALQWYEAAALQGNRKAMHALAIAYAEGLGVAKSPSESVRWFSRAASFGYVDSQFNLAVLYEQGAGVPQSLLDAYKWYTVAEREGDGEAKLRMDALGTQLSADDLAAAQRAAAAFHALPMDVAANTLP